MLRQFIRRELRLVRPRMWFCMPRAYSHRRPDPSSLAKEIIGSALNSIEQLVYRELDHEHFEAQQRAQDEASSGIVERIKTSSTQKWKNLEVVNISLPEHRMLLMNSEIVTPFEGQFESPLLWLEHILKQDLGTRLSPVHYLRLYLLIDNKETIPYSILCDLVKVLTLNTWYNNASAIIEESRLDVMALFDMMEEHVVPTLTRHHPTFGIWDFLKAYLRTSNNLPLIKQMIQEFLSHTDPRVNFNTVRALQFMNLLESKYLGDPWGDNWSKHSTWESLQTDLLRQANQFLGFEKMPQPVLAYMFFVRFDFFSRPPAQSVSRALASEFKRGKDYLILPGVTGKAISLFGANTSPDMLHRNDHFAQVLCHRIKRSGVSIGPDDMLAILNFEMNPEVAGRFIKQFWGFYTESHAIPHKDVLHATLTTLQRFPHTKTAFIEIFSNFWSLCDADMVAEWMCVEYWRFQEKHPAHSKVKRLDAIWEHIDDREMREKVLTKFQNSIMGKSGLSFPHCCVLIDAFSQHHTVPDEVSSELIKKSFSKNLAMQSSRAYLDGLDMLLNNVDVGMETRGAASMKALKWVATIPKHSRAAKWVPAQVTHITSRYFIDATVSEAPATGARRPFKDRLDIMLDQDDSKFGEPKKLKSIQHLAVIAEGLSQHSLGEYVCILRTWIKLWSKHYGVEVKNEHYTLATAIKYLTRVRLGMPCMKDKSLEISALIDKTYGHISGLAIERSWVPEISVSELERINYHLTIPAKAFLIKRLARIEPLTANQFIKAYGLKAEVPKPLLRGFITGILESDSAVSVDVKARIFNHISSKIRSRATGYTGKQTAIALVNTVIADAISKDKGSSDRLMWALEICRSEKVSEKHFSRWFTILEELRRQKKGFWSQQTQQMKKEHE